MNNKIVNIALDKLSNSVGFLSLGYQLVSFECRAASNLLSESYYFRFSNKNRRSVQVIFYPANGDDGFFLVNLINDSCEEVFNIKDWLKMYGETEKVSPFKLTNYSGCLDEKLDGFVEYLDGIFKTERLKNILLGNSWESVSFDWAGMR